MERLRDQIFKIPKIKKFSIFLSFRSLKSVENLTFPITKI